MIHTHACKVFDLFTEYEAVQANRVLEAIKAIPGARIIGQDSAAPGTRAATIAFTLDGVDCSGAVKFLVENQIAVRSGQ